MQRNTINNIWELPESIFVNEKEYSIRTDFRVVLDLFTALNDEDMQGENEFETNEIHARLMLEIMLPDYESLSMEDIPIALDEICNFIDMGADEDNGKPHPKVMDWQQDSRLIIPAINRVVGHDIRTDKYVHWWTFVSAYMEIGECTFTHILSIRQKKAKGKKLEKWEQEYIRDNKNLVLLRDKGHERSEEEKQALKDLLYGKNNN